jgi:hypothetical protein
LYYIYVEVKIEYNKRTDMAYPSTKTTFQDPSGTAPLATGPDHAALHTSVNDTIEALEDTLGTTAGTSVLKNFAVGDFSARINTSNVLQQTLQGTINTSVFGTPAITGGTITGAFLGTNQLTGGTVNLVTMGTPAITGGTATNINLATGTITGGISLQNNGSITQTGTGDHITLTPGTGKLVRTAILRQDGTTNTYVNTISILGGFKPLMVASGQSVGTLHIDFGGTFAAAPLVIPQIGGFTTAGSPSLITSLTTSISGVGFTQGFGWDTITTTGFNVSLKASGNAGADSWYGITWIALGVLT